MRRAAKGRLASRARFGIGIFAPSGFVTDPIALERCIMRFEQEGHRVFVDATARGRWQRFSASDAERVAAFGRMADDERIDLVIAARGGYGLSRLLDRLDFAHLARSRKRWIGHSDFTAFHLAALARANLVTYAGPMACYDFGVEEPSERTLREFWGVMREPRHRAEFAADARTSLCCEGVLWGGNLAIMASLVGTPFLPTIEGGILFLEDIAEHPYRVERMLLQLDQAGVLRRQKAVLMGTFSDYSLGANDGGYDLDTAVAHLRARSGVPFICGLPFGHCPDKLTLPVGARCRLDVENGKASLELDGYVPRDE